MSIQVGDTLGDYEVTGVLGSGGMGRVFKVRNVLSNRLEAMKVLLPEALGTADHVERFMREIRVQASLEHPNIAALRTALRIDNQLVMVMELVEGKTLQAMLERGPLSMNPAIDYMSQALEALSYAHGRGVIHRDIKPGNIMLTEGGIIKLTDFGIAKASVDRSLTTAGSTMGSIYYMSPEQVKGSATLDGRSDLYSLGVTLYESVTGSRPFQDATDYAILTAHLSEAPVPPREKNPAIPPELNQVILKAMAKDPAGRFQTAADFRQALQNIRTLPEESPATRPIAIPDAVAARGGSGTATTQSGKTRTAGGSASTLETAYVLFMDIVAYSTLTMDRQTERITKLVEIVRDTDEYRRAQENDQIISLPTGDGMALVFFQNPIAPIQCATEVSRTLKSHPEIKLRMGIHAGLVYRIPDINTNRNVAGGGINMAQRVMDCGDAGHILVSKDVADNLGQLSNWEGNFHDLGEAEVKHGVKVRIVNFYTDEIGNQELPQKIRKAITVQAQTVPTVPVPSISPAPSPAPISAAPTVSPAPITSSMPVAAPRRNTGLLVGVGLVAVVLLAFGASQFMHRQGGGSGRNTEMPASLAPSMPTTPAPPPPPTGGMPAAIPPSGSMPPPQTPPVASTPSQAAPAPIVSKPAEAPQKLSAKAAAAAPQKMPPSQAAPIAAASAPPPAQAAAGSAEKALLQEQRERMMLLAGRAGALRGSLDNLQRQQNASGLGLRGDMAAAKESMEYLMGEAKNSMAAGDAAAAKRNLDLAEQQVEKLERFLGR